MADRPTVVESDPPEDSALRSTGFVFVAQIVSAGFTAVLTLYLVRALNPSGYGLFTLAAAIEGLLLLPADFGVSNSTARFIAERRREPLAAAGYISAALRLKIATTGVISIALLLASTTIASAYNKPDLTWVLRGIAIALFAESLLQLLTYAFVARGKARTNLVAVATESATETITSVALVASGGGAVGAAFGRAIGYLVGLACALTLTVRSLGRTAVQRAPDQRVLVRRIARYGGILLVVESAYSIFSAIDVLVIGRLLPAASVGLFTAPLRVVAFLQLPTAAIAAAVSPRMALVPGAGRDDRTFARATRVVILLQFAVLPPVLVWATPIVLNVLGPKYQDSVPVFRALAPFAFLLGFGTLFSTTATYIGQARRRVPIAVATVIINLVADLILIPRIGIVGGAYGTDIAYAVYVPTHYLICRETLDVEGRLASITVIRAAVATLLMAGVLFVFGTGDLPLYRLVVGAVVATVVYVGCVMATARLRWVHGEGRFGV